MPGRLEKGQRMAGYADKLQKRAAELLGPDEQLISAVRTQPRGTNLSAAGGIIGAVASDRQAKKATAGATEGSNAGTWPTGNCAVGLTNQRLLLFNYTALGKPKDLVAEFPLADVGSIELQKKKITANALRFAFTDGSSVEVECAKMEKTQAFVDAFAAQQAGS
jgi:hypothetical protein